MTLSEDLLWLLSSIVLSSGSFQNRASLCVSCAEWLINNTHLFSMALEVWELKSAGPF